MRLYSKAFTLLTVFLFVSCASSTTEKISTQLPLEKATNPDCLDDCDALKKIDSAKLANEVDTDRSVFQIRGLGCNFLQFGTGFFVEKDLLITNAHVVAGVNLPVILYEGKEHVLELVSFDPNSDLAVLRAPFQTEKPLELANADEGETATVVAYLKDGQRIVEEVKVKSKILAVGKDIFGEEGDSREALSLEASIESGFSGSPVLNKDSSVIGVVFSRSRGGASTAYAVQSSEVKRILEEEADLGGSAKCMP